MLLSQEACENGWGYKLEFDNKSSGFILLFPSNRDTSEIRKLGFSKTKISYGDYDVWVATTKGQRTIEVIGFFRRRNLLLISEDELLEKCFPFKIKGYRPRRL